MQEEELKELLIPNTTGYIVLAKLHGTGHKTASGYYSTYDTTYPNALRDRVSIKQFNYGMYHIHQVISDYFPCPPCILCSSICYLFTCGYSIYCKEPCTKDLHENLHFIIGRINTQEVFLYHGILWTFQYNKQQRDSWIEIRQILN